MKKRCNIPGQGRAGGVFTATLLTCCAWFLLSGQLVADDRPPILVNFSFEGDMFAGLPAAERARIETSVEEKLCELAESRWGFLNWTHDLPEPSGSAQWNVVLSVEIRPVTKDNGETTAAFIGTLKHSGLHEARSFAFVQNEENETIYPMGRSIPFHNAQALEDDLLRQLDRQLGSLLEKNEVEAYLQKIPIADNLITDSANTRVLVPVQINDLRTRRDSVLEVSFISSDQQQGFLELLTAREVVDEGEHKGYVHGRVKDFDLPQVNFPLPTYWDDQMSTVLGSATDFKVYMIDYRSSPAGASVTEDNIVLEPDM